MMAESEEVVKLVDGAYKNILEKFNPCARQLISTGKQYLKALHGAVAASKSYIEALTKLARHAHQGTWGGCTDIGTALLQLVDVQKDIQAQQLNILKAFYVDLLVPLESNIDKDTKVVACEQKRFLQQHKGLQDSYLKAAAAVRKQRKKSKGGGRTGHLEKEIKTLQLLEEEKMKLDCFCEKNLKQAITQERRRFGFVLERQCSLIKHNLVYHSQGQGLLQRHLEEWEEIAKAREALPSPIDQLFRSSSSSYSNCSEYACANLLDRAPPASLYASSPAHGGGGGGGTLRKTRSIDASCVDMRGAPLDPFPRPLARARSEFNIASSNVSVASNDYGVGLRPRSLRPQDLKGPQSRVRALYSYLSSGEHQLSFHEGDVIGLIGDRNKGWQYGENQRNHRRGWFPIAYTAVLSEDSIHDMQNGSHSELQRRSSELVSPYSCNGVSRSRTTPNMQNGTFRSSSSSSSSPSERLPPPPQNVQRPLSTFVDAFTAKNLDTYQDVQFGPRILQPSPGVPLRGAPAPTSAPPTRPPLTPEEPPPASSGALRLGAAPPRRLPPLSAAAPSASLHSSNDSGFGSENPPPPLSLTSPGFEIDSGKSRENLFSTVKLRKVITNDRSAPMIS